MKDNYNEQDNERIAPDVPIEGGAYIDKIFEKFGIDINSPEIQLNIRWADIVGKELSKVIGFDKITEGTLSVVCKSASIASYVRLNSSDIVKKVNSSFPELGVKKLAVRVQPYLRY
jgi:hypothetical protein